MSEDRLIPTLAMTLDPRLRRLFALIGTCLEEEDVADPDTESALYGILLAIAPEYLPPDEFESDELRAQWRAMVESALSPCVSPREAWQIGAALEGKG